MGKYILGRILFCGVQLYGDGVRSPGSGQTPKQSILDSLRNRICFQVSKPEKDFDQKLNFLQSGIDARAPQAAIAILSVLAAVLALTAPETKDKPMPENMEQFDPGCMFRRHVKRPKETHASGDIASNAVEVICHYST